MTKAGSDDLDWDENGNLVEGLSSIDFDWNWVNKLRKGKIDASNYIELKYDPMGNRVYKKSVVSGSSTERKYIVDISGKLPTILCELDTSGSLKKSYVYTPNSQILYQRDHTKASGSDEFFYVHDRLGSVRLVVDESETTKNSYTYDPTGVDFATEIVENTDNAFKFTGQWYDDEISQYYLRARMYDPELMRFTGYDPVRGKFGQPLTLHRYLYCNNSPINFVDLNGKWAMYFTLSSHAAFAPGAMGQIGFAWDDDGNFEMFSLTGYGAGTPDASVGFSFGWNQADTIYDFEGSGISTGGSLSLFGATVGGEYVSGGIGKRGFEINLALSVVPAEMHAFVTEMKIMDRHLARDGFIEASMNFSTYGEARAMLIMAGFFH